MPARLHEKIPHNSAAKKRQQCTGTPRNALRGRCGCHEANAERAQLVPHPLKSVGLQATGQISRRSPDTVRDAARGHWNLLQYQHETELYLQIEGLHQQRVRYYSTLLQIIYLLNLISPG